MEKSDFDIYVNAWLYDVKQEMIDSNDYTQDDFDVGEVPDPEYFEVFWDDVIATSVYINDGQACHELRDFIPKHMIVTSDADVLVECQFGEHIDLAFMYRIATNDAFRAYLHSQFEEKFCKSVDNNEPVV